MHSTSNQIGTCIIRNLRPIYPMITKQLKDYFWSLRNKSSNLHNTTNDKNYRTTMIQTMLKLKVIIIKFYIMKNFQKQ